jgi:hypothetical protein
MPKKVATYYQLQDNPVDVSAAALTLNQGVVDTPAGGEGALMTWQAAAVVGGGTVTYKVEVNGNLLGNYTALQIPVAAGQPDFGIPVQEATVTSDVKRGPNKLVFTRTSATGTLRLSAVMLWHRVDV